MAKWGRVPKLDEAQPVPPISLLNPPAWVEVRYNWAPPFQVEREKFHAFGWALAYCHHAGLVIWQGEPGQRPMMAWLPAEDIRRVKPDAEERATAG